MNDDNRRLFERLSKKMGWNDQEGGLDRAERKLMSTIGKTRHGAMSGHPCVDRSASPTTVWLSDDEDEAEKENFCSKGNDYRNKSLIESSDDDFDQFLVGRATPRAKPVAQKTCSATKKEYPTVVVASSDDEDNFETFLQKVKTPTTKHNKKPQSESEDSLKHFIVDDYSSGDDFVTPFSFKVPKKSNTPASKPPRRRPLSQLESPVFFTDSDDDLSDILVKSTWRTRHSKPQPATKSNSDDALLCRKDEHLPSPPVCSVQSPFPFHPPKTPTTLPECTSSASSKLDESASSDEEFTSLLERLKMKNKLVDRPFSPKNIKESSKKPPVLIPPTERRPTPASKSLGETPLKTPGKSTILKPTVSQTEPRHCPTSRVALCKTPGCFLQSLSNPGSSSVQNFKKNKENLTAKLYQLYNTSVFDSKFPADMSVTWNKKMRKTAGYCITGQERGSGSRYARIELSEKVCDSADRLRDTLIHEMCHAATWLINGVRDGHGQFWKFYARKSTVVHPELPMVTRCHTYDIKYKFQYQCTRCQNTIGRHSKSLDTERFACALCNGRITLLTPSKPRAPTPFANFVKENFKTTRQELAGQSHAEVMRKLSADFSSKTKLSQS